jgi:hypothetical protein
LVVSFDSENLLHVYKDIFVLSVRRLDACLSSVASIYRYHGRCESPRSDVIAEFDRCWDAVDDAEILLQLLPHFLVIDGGMGVEQVQVRVETSAIEIAHLRRVVGLESLPLHLKVLSSKQRGRRLKNVKLEGEFARPTCLL